MVTIKSFTDLQQSNVLAEFLPIESADMVIWGKDLDSIAVTDAQKFMSGLKNRKMNYLPCWSLAALLDILPNGIVMNKDSQNGRYHFSSKYVGTYVTADNPIDACVAMIEKLHEQNLL